MQDHPSRDIISRYLDGELDPGFVSRLEAHLESCPRCRKAAQELERAGDFIRLVSAANSSPPARLDRMIREKFVLPMPEVFLGVIKFNLSRSNRVSGPGSGPAPAIAAEPPADYVAGSPPAAPRRFRRTFSAEGITAAVEISRQEDGSAACRITIRDRSGRPIDGVEIRLEQAARPPKTDLTGGEGGVFITHLRPGRYSLRIGSGPTYGLTLVLS